MGFGLRARNETHIHVSHLRTYASFVRFSHPVFALAFALSG